MSQTKKPERESRQFDRRQVLRILGGVAATPFIAGACADLGVGGESGEIGPDGGPSDDSLEEIEATGAQKRLAGPMVGAVTATTAKLWALASGAGTVRARHRVKGTTTWQTTSVSVGSTSHFTGHLTLSGLSAAKQYEYQVQVDADTWSPLASFRTAPAPGTSGQFRFGFGSCASRFEDPEQPSWRLLREENPAFYLHLGDMTYYPSPADDPVWQDPNAFIADAWARHTGQRNIPSCAEFMRNVPFYATWSDHDYGPNNSGRLMTGGRDGLPTQSMTLWKQIWANPSYGTSSVPGVFFKFGWRNVNYFVLDGRWYKDGDANKGTQIFGAAQVDWLIAGLRASTAPFKFIAADVPSNGWSWGVADRDRLVNAINKYRIKGIIILTGDPHQVELHDSNSWGVKPAYVISDVVSSGIGRVHAPPTQGYALFDIDTTLADPKATLRMVAGNGATSLSQTGTWKLLGTKTIRASQLKGAGW